MKRVKGLIMLTSICPPESMTSSVKIARFLSKLFNFPIYAWKSHGELVSADWVFFVNSSTLFSHEDYRLFSQDVLRHAKNVVYVQNDYMLPFSTKWKNAAHEGAGSNVFYWSSVERVVAKKGGALLDWNRLAYVSPQAKPGGGRNGGLFYYGACRQNRVKEFNRWFGRDAVSTVISVPTVPQQKKFDALKLHPDMVRVMVDKTDIVKQLALYHSTIYLEDPYSSRNYCSPANRFYEALSAGTAIAVADTAVNTFRRAELALSDDWVVTGKSDLRAFMRSATSHARQQARLWRAYYIGDLRTQVRREAKLLGVL